MYFYNNSYVYTGLFQSATDHFLFHTCPKPLCLALCNLRILQEIEFLFWKAIFKIPLHHVLSMKECTFGKSAIFWHFWGVWRPQMASLLVVLIILKMRIDEIYPNFFTRRQSVKQFSFKSQKTNKKYEIASQSSTRRIF